MRFCSGAVVCLFIMSLSSTEALGQATGFRLPSRDFDSNNLNIPSKTMGGQQFWTDVYFEGGWHIQQNPMTNHHRLLDPQDVRHAWGTMEQCESVLSAKRANGEVLPYQGRVVILLHGLNRTHSSMEAMAKTLRSDHGFQTINFQYASSRRMVQDHAGDLARVIDGLGPDVSEIYFVAHSMGNLVIRNYLHQRQNVAEGHSLDPRLTRMVMLGPPNQGSQLARLFRHNLTFRAVAGVSGQQLAKSWGELSEELAIPHFPFAIIAGGGETGNLFERAVFDGPSDLVVSVNETKLEGAALHLQLPVAHTFMMEDPKVMNIAAQFLSTGTVE